MTLSCLVTCHDQTSLGATVSYAVNSSSDVDKNGENQLSSLAAGDALLRREPDHDDRQAPRRRRGQGQAQYAVVIWLRDRCLAGANVYCAPDRQMAPSNLNR